MRCTNTPVEKISINPHVAGGGGDPSRSDARTTFKAEKFQNQKQSRNWI